MLFLLAKVNFSFLSPPLPSPPSRRDAAQGSRQKQAASSPPERHDPERHRGKELAAGQSDRPGRLWLDLFR